MRDRRAGRQAHVGQRARHALAFDGIALLCRVGDPIIHRHDHFRRRAPGDLRLEGRRVNTHYAIEFSLGVAVQVAPRRQRFFPQIALGGIWTAPYIFDGLLVHRHQAGARAGLDGHIAHRHAAFHREIADRLAAEFDGIAGTARGANLADNGQDDILGGHARPDFAVDAHEHVLGLLLHQTLGGQRVFDFGSAYAEGQRTQRAMCRGVRIAAHHGHARQSRPLFRADDMDDALAYVIHLEFGDPKLGAIAVQRFDLQARDRIGDTLATIGGGYIVVGRGQIGRATPHIATGQSQPLEGLRRGDFMHQLTIYVDETTTVFAATHHMGVPQFVVKGSCNHDLPLNGSRPGGRRSCRRPNR